MDADDGMLNSSMKNVHRYNKNILIFSFKSLSKCSNKKIGEKLIDDTSWFQNWCQKEFIRPNKLLCVTYTYPYAILL